MFLPHLVHHEGSVPFEERHHRLRPFEDRTLLRRQQPKDPAGTGSRSSLIGRATELIHELMGIERHGLEVLVHHPAEERPQPRRRRELHAVGDLVDRDPQSEVAWDKTVSALHLDQVGTDEVDQPVIVRREENVELPEDPSRDVAEDRTRLCTDGFARDRRPGGTFLQQPLSERFHEPLEPSDVLPDPSAPAHHPCTGTEPGDGEVGEPGDELLGSKDVRSEILAHPGAIFRGNDRPGPRDTLADLQRDLPVRESGRMRAHRPVDVCRGIHRRAA